MLPTASGRDSTDNRNERVEDKCPVADARGECVERCGDLKGSASERCTVCGLRGSCVGEGEGVLHVLVRTKRWCMYSDEPRGAVVWPWSEPLFPRSLCVWRWGRLRVLAAHSRWL